MCLYRNVTKKILLGLSLLSSILCGLYAATPGYAQSGGNTWFIRADGGTRYSPHAQQGQCDGLADKAYPGKGTNQHCAFKDYRYLWDDQTYGNNGWVIVGGDTVIVRNGPWRVGFNQGSNPQDVWCLGGNGPFSCGNPTIPAGTAARHTRILGENYASCSGTNKTQIFGGFGLGSPMNLKGAQFVDVECLEITRHSQCIQHGQPVNPSRCSSGYPIDDYDSDGIQTDVNTHDILLQDLWIHGHPDRGIIGPIGGTLTANRVDIAYNGESGWDFDDGAATPSKNGVWNFTNSTIEWSGCNQEYPIAHTYPAISCYSQSTSGYGDGVGTPAGTGISANIDRSTFRYNTQDGLDLGHVDTGKYSLSITNSTAYGNSGGQFKWGPNEVTAVFANNFVEGNCLRLSQPISGTPASFNANLEDFCRAQDTLSFNFRQGGTLLMANNTIVSYAPTTFDINCWDSSCSNSTFQFENNIVRGYDNPATYNMGGQAGGPGGIYYQQAIGHVIRKNNLFFGLREGCSGIQTSELCLDPLFVGEPTFTGEASLDNYNYKLTAGSPARGSGSPLNIAALAKDLLGVVRPNPPSIGALEFGAGSSTPTSPAPPPALEVTGMLIKPIKSGNSLTLLAIVYAPAGGTPTGSVKFTANGQTLGTAPLSGGNGTLVIAAAPATKTVITATYSGAATFAASTTTIPAP